MAAVIDAHVHVWSSDVENYPLAAGFDYPTGQPRSFTADEYLEQAQSIGVARAVLIQSDFYNFDNSYLLDSLQRFPGVFSGIGQVDESRADPAAEMRKLKSGGVRGIRIMPRKCGDPAWLDTPGMHSVWKCAAEEGLSICPLIDAPDLPAVSRVCRQFPATRVVVDHAANIGSDGQFREEDIDLLCDLADFPNAYVKLSGFYYLGQKHPPYNDLAPLLKRLVSAFGCHRLMWGSDCPFQLTPPNTYRASLELIVERLEFLTATDKQWLLEGTAEKLFFDR